MDRGNLQLRDLHPQTNQGVAADAIATLEGISRTALDELAVESQRRAAIAIEEGRFDKSLVPVLNEDGTVALDREEFPRPGTTLESLARLPSRSEEHTSELQSLMRNSYAVFCLNKQKNN